MHPSFLEAHFYAGGLRHRPYLLQGDRPEWAPAPDVVGFSDEFLLAPNVAALEIRRLEHERRRLTWLAVYHPSVDTRLGDRKNHAGVGIWLDELTIVDGRSLVHGLDILAKKLAESIDPEGLEKPAREFLKEYVPQYVLPLRNMPEFPGLRFSAGRLASTRLVHIQTDQSLGEAPQVSDRVLAALFSSPDPRETSRELICVSANPIAAKDAARFHIVTNADDALSKVIQEIPGAIKSLATERDATLAKLDAISHERDAAKARAADFDQLQDRVRGFESDPLHTVLNAIREVGHKIDMMATRIDQPRQISPTRTPVGRIVRPPVATSEPVPAQQTDWLSVVVLAILIMLVVGVLFTAVDKFLWPVLWPGS